MKKTISSLFLTSTIFLIIGFSNNSQDLINLNLSFRKIDANNINTNIRNDGSFDRDFNTFNAGFEWPKGSGQYAVYSSGLWLSCKVHDSVRVSVAEYNSEFSPGYFDFATQTPAGRNDPLFRLYKVSPLYPEGNSDFDPWLSWPVAHGAPWVDVNNNSVYDPPADHPLMKGDQNLFCSFTDGYRDSSVFSSYTPPMRAEIHLYVWAKQASICADAINYEWKIINKNVSGWNDMSAAVWSDVDLGSALNDMAGTDSVLNLAYGYNATNNDPVYGLAPPAVGITVKDASGHAVNKSDFAARWRCASDCPVDSIQKYRVLHGYRINGDRWINPFTNTPTNYPYSGIGGWNDSTAGDRYIIIGSIFGNVASLDTVEFKTVSFIKRGANNLLSVTELKNCVNSVIGIKNGSENVSDNFRLYQNYPNPFNPVTKINYELSVSNYVSLKVYDILGNEIKTLISQRQNAGIYEAEFDGSDLSSGIYFYTLNAGKEYSKTKKMLLLK